MFDFIKTILGTKDDARAKMELIDAGACPNCWGSQEYDNQFKEFVEDKTKANIEGDTPKTFIQQFVETNVTGIRLKSEEDRFRCPSCEGGYKVVRLPEA